MPPVPSVNNTPPGAVVWFTGLSGAGKTTISVRVAEIIRERGRSLEVLDGDIIRTHLSKGLGFSKEDRDTNVRRIAFVGHLLQRNRVLVLVASISPYRAIRAECREMIGDFVEVHVATPIEECERRDVKGLYARARAGEIKRFTGIDDPYEAPEAAELVIDTTELTVEASAQLVIAKLEALGYLNPA